MIRNILAVVVGLVVGMAFNMFMVIVNTAIYPMPEGVTFEDPEGLEAYLAGLPLTAFLIVLLAHVGQAFFGGLVAAAINRKSAIRVAMIVGLLSMLFGIANMMMVPHPAWMWIEMPLYLLAAYAAAKILLCCRKPGPETD